MQLTGFKKITNRLYRSLPLIPIHCGLFVFIALLSPLTWGIAELSLLILGLSALFGVICAYSTTIFLDEYLSKK